MNRYISIGFLFIYLSAATELHQLLRVPVFFAHYQEHKQLNASLSLVDFVVLHYFKPDNGKDLDDERDKQLPFKSHDCAELALPSVILPADIPEPASKKVCIIKHEVSRITSFIPTNHSSGIWQPPRIS